MFYTFSQNNSGGFFDYSHDVTEYVIIEADSADEANETARDIGIYFDGVDYGSDCECCGDRWYPAYGDGNDVPSIYGEPVEEHDFDRMRWLDVPCYVYYKDGSREVYGEQ